MSSEVAAHPPTWLTNLSCTDPGTAGSQRAGQARQHMQQVEDPLFCSSHFPVISTSHMQKLCRPSVAQRTHYTAICVWDYEYACIYFLQPPPPPNQGWI